MPFDHTLLVLGATGDLTGRLLLPALARLWHAGELTAGFRFVGAGPQDWDRTSFQDHARIRLADHAADVPVLSRENFLQRLDFRQVDVLGAAGVSALQEFWANTTPTTIYLALPTHLLPPTVAALGRRRLPASVRIAVEKPFGECLETAVALNSALIEAVDGSHKVFRVDHVLGMDSVAQLPRTIAALHSAGSPAHLEIEEVSILWEETLALEGRAAFYDGAGALKDLLQNHLLQILCMVILGHASGPVGHTLSDRRLEALRTIAVPSIEQARLASHRARYTAGRLAVTGGAQGALVPDYVQESGVDPDRNTETLAEVTLMVSGTHWADTRFVLRAGKALGQRRRGVLVKFRREPAATERPDVWIDVDRPETTPSGSLFDGEPNLAPLEQIAYVTVLRGLLSGSDELSVSATETEMAWSLFTPVLEAWSRDLVPLEHYAAGAIDLPAGFGG